MSFYRKEINNFIAAVIFSLCIAPVYADYTGGYIADIAPCDANGTIINPDYSIDDGMKPSETMYFMIRFANPNYSTEKWRFVAMNGFETMGAILPPRIGIFVSGVLDWAEFYGYAPTTIPTVTDVIFKYTVRAGDFALPITLALNENGTAIPASNYKIKNTSPYYLDLTRYSSESSDLGWRLRHSATADGVTTWTDAVWSYYTYPTYISNPSGYWNLSKWESETQTLKGFYIRGIDFASNWTMNNVLWRTVHEGSENGDRTPQLEATTATDRLVKFYVWSLNEDAVVVSGPKVNEVSMLDPENTSSTKKYKVGTITFNQGSVSADFAIKGVSCIENNGKATLVLSAYDHFNMNDSTGDIVEDYVTVPVRCIEPVPPSVLIEAEKTTAYATSDYGVAANRLTIKLSEEIADSVTVRITPHLSNGAYSDEYVAENYVRFSKYVSDVGSVLPDPVFPEVTLSAANSEASMYVFCLRGDDNTMGLNMLEFRTSRVEGGSAIDDENFNKAAINVVAQNPEITVPVEGATIDAVQFDETPVEIRVSDTYADMLVADTNKGCKIYVKYHPTDTEHADGAPSGFKLIEGCYKPGEGGILERCDDGSKDMPIFSFNTTGEYETKLYVVSPVSGNKSCGIDADYRTIKAVVRPPKLVAPSTADGKIEFEEGDTTTINIELSEAMTEDVWAYLRINSTDVEPSQFSSPSYFIVGMTNSSGKVNGLRIPRGFTKGSAKLTFLDGYGPTTGDFLICDFDVVLSTTNEFTCTSKTDVVPSRVKNCNSEILTVSVVNREPVIKRIELNGNESEYSGYVYDFQATRGVEQQLKAIVSDVAYDLDNDFLCKWTVYVGGIAYNSVVTSGNPDTHPFKFNFPRTGTNKVRLQVKDKDMDDWSDTVYEVSLVILDYPTITVDIDEQVLPENTKKHPIKVGLSNWPNNATNLHVRLRVDPVRSNSNNPGELLFDQSYCTPPFAGIAQTNNVYYLEFTDCGAQTINIMRMDGTDSSDVWGFRITADVIDTGISDDPTKTWAEFFLANSSTIIYPYNVEPNCGYDLDKTFSPQSNIGADAWTTARALSWRVYTDVDGDFREGITIKYSGANASTYNEDGFVNGEKKIYGASAGSWTPDFGWTTGDQSVSISIFDKDGGEISRSWNFACDAQPLVFGADSCEFSDVSQTISMSSDFDGAKIYYTVDGSDPAVNGIEYTKSFEVYKTTSVRAIARKDGWADSAEVTATYTRQDALGEAANFYLQNMEADGDADWAVDASVSHDGESSVRSGEIEKNQSCGIQISAKKAGTLSFWWKADCEENDSDEGDEGWYDYGILLIDDEPITRIAGKTDWQQIVYEVPSTGKHIVRWEYRKDGATNVGSDCIWVDQIQWVPAAENDAYITVTTPVQVPYSWLKNYGWSPSCDYEAIGAAMSGKTQGGKATKVWEEYVAGTDPTNANSVFSAKIDIVDGLPRVKWSPDLNEDGTKSLRSYKVWGKESLEDVDWICPTNALHRFFKVTVEMP